MTSDELIVILAEQHKKRDDFEIYKTMQSRCMKCRWRGSTGNASSVYCNWSFLNYRNMRDCLPDMNCKYYEKGPLQPTRKQISIDLTRREDKRGMNV